MKVRCIKNNLNQIEDSLMKEKLKKALDVGEDYEFAIPIGRDFIVYGISNSFNKSDIPFFFVCEIEELKIPTPLPSVLFELVDPRPSQFWLYSQKTTEHTVIDLNIPEWINDRSFYWKLTEGEPREVATFLKYKKLMDYEFDPRNLEDESKDENGVPRNLRVCWVCGNEKANFYPWGVEGSTPNYEICDCCGAQFGIDDCELSEIKHRRSEWISNGGRWCFPDSKPSDWTLERSIKKIPLNFE